MRFTYVNTAGAGVILFHPFATTGENTQTVQTRILYNTSIEINIPIIHI